MSERIIDKLRRIDCTHGDALEAADHIAALESKLSAAEARIGRLQREVKARRKAEINLGWGGADDAVLCAAQVCDAHNDLVPPQAEGVSDGA